MKKPYKLPDALQAARKKYPIKTDYRDWLAFEQILDRADLTEEEKQVFALRRVLKSPPPSDALAFLELFLRAAWFCRCGLPVVPEDDSRKTLDFYKDFWAVWADFLTYNHVDLLKETLHWWQFMALFQSLPEEAQIKRRIGIRSVTYGELSKIKNSKQRRQIKRLQQLYALEDDCDEDDD